MRRGLEDAASQPGGTPAQHWEDEGPGARGHKHKGAWAVGYASSLPGVPLAQPCEDEGLAAGGHMHEGAWSSKLGIAGQPAEAEEVMVMRDIALARLTGTDRKSVV